LLLDVSSPIIVVTAAKAAIPVFAPVYDGVTEAAGGGADTVVLAPIAGADTPKSYTLGDNVENGIVAGVDAGLPADLPFSLVGNALDNSLTGNQAANTLIGNAGADLLNGGAGLDTLIGGAGDDTYFLLDVSSPIIVVTAAKAAIPVFAPVYDGVTEAAGGGADTVIVSLVPGPDTPRSYTLGANIENGMVAGVDTGQSSDLPFSLVGNGLDNLLTGNNDGNTLSGKAGNDTLNGKAGLDTLVGGGGDDLYLVLDATTTLEGTPIPHFVTLYDTVAEAAGGGTDTVVVARAVGLVALTSYTLGANVENGIIGGRDAGLSSDRAFSLTGNALANGLIGNRAANTLDGGAGADFMAGGRGNDFYFVDNTGDSVNENRSQGTDTVKTVLPRYTLDANVENLVFIGTGSFTGIGNSLGNTISGRAGGDTLAGAVGDDTLNGHAGDDTLNGGVGADKMAGGIGNDTYIVDVAGDVVTENLDQGIDTVRTTLASYTLGANVENLVFIGAGNFAGTGNALANRITGGAGSNTLGGGGGGDTLVTGRRSTMTGGGGGDRFFFTTPGSSAAPNANKITDFGHAVDRLVVGDAGFNLGADEGKGTGALQRIEASVFSTRTNGTFAAAGNRFAYDRATGALFYDADGSRGGSSRLLVATLTTHPTLAASDIFFTT
jgi:Ca2+-binding RTX toxin-like protein